MATKNKTRIKPKKQQNTPLEERVLTRNEFYKILNRVIQPIPLGKPKAKPTKKEKKGTSE